MTTKFSNVVSTRSRAKEAGTTAAPPLHRAAAVAPPKRAATVGITIPQIAPADKPLLDFLARYYH